jgi:hypothetical protein
MVRAAGAALYINATIPRLCSIPASSTCKPSINPAFRLIGAEPN